jgi:hypothetical protein
MGTAQYAVSNFTVDDPATIKVKIDGNSEVLRRVGSAYQCYANTPAAMTVKVAAGALDVRGVWIENGIQTSSTITAPASNPRIDRVVIDSRTGVAAIVQGTEAASPVPAAVPPGKLAVAQIALSVGMGNIPDTAITDERMQRSPSRTGEVVFWPGLNVPAEAFECDGVAYSRTTYAALFAELVKSATATITIASPGVVTWNAHGLKNNFPIKFTTTGALPTGLLVGRTYWIKNAAANTFELALVPGGVSINTSGGQSGTHTAICAPCGDGDGSTTFNVPNMIDAVPIGYGAAVVTESFAPADVTLGTDAITIQDNVVKWVTGMLVTLTTTGTAPTGLTAGNPYYVIRTGQGQIKLASSLANAQNGTVIDITGQGTGVHTITHSRTVRGLGERGGEDAHAMSLTELLSHFHNTSFTISNTPGGTSQIDANGAGTIGNVNSNSDSKGGNAAMNIMQPFGAGRWIIYFA